MTSDSISLFPDMPRRELLMLGDHYPLSEMMKNTRI